MRHATRKGGRAVPRERPERSSAGDVQPHDAQADAHHDEREEAARAGPGARGLAVDLGDGVQRCEECVVVVDGVQDGDQVREARDEADGYLQAQGNGHVARRVRNLLGEMCDGVYGPDTVCTVEHARDEDEAVWVANVGSPLRPDGARRCVGWSPVPAGHDSHDDDGDDEEGEDGKDAKLVQRWHRPVGETHGRARQDRRDDVHDEDVPRLRHERRVRDGVHLDDGIRKDTRHTRGAQHPGKVIPPTRKEPDDPATSPSRRDARPVVHARGRGHGAGQLGDAGGHVPVEHGHGDELVQHARRPAVEDGDEDGPADGGPDVADDEADACEGEEGEVAAELLHVAGGVDDHTPAAGVVCDLFWVCFVVGECGISGDDAVVCRRGGGVHDGRVPIRRS